MDLQMRLIPRIEQTVYLIPEYEISRVLTTTSPFQENIPTKNDILSYLAGTNGSLKEHRNELAILYQQYVTALSVYTCVRPVVHLSLPESLSLNFASIIKKRPYLLRDPLEIIFTKNQESIESKVIEPLLNAHIVDIEGEVPSSFSTKFKLSNFIKNKITSGLRIVSQNLQKEYGEHNHLLFMSIKAICLPLFGMSRQAEEYQDFSDALQQKYGYLYLKVPLFLSPERNES